MTENEINNLKDDIKDILTNFVEKNPDNYDSSEINLIKDDKSKLKNDSTDSSKSSKLDLKVVENKEEVSISHLFKKLK